MASNVSLEGIGDTDLYLGCLHRPEIMVVLFVVIRHSCGRIDTMQDVLSLSLVWSNIKRTDAGPGRQSSW